MFNLRRTLLIMLIVCVILSECRRQRYTLRKRKRTSPSISATFRVVPYRKPWRHAYINWDRDSSDKDYSSSLWNSHAIRQRSDLELEPYYDNTLGRADVSYIDPEDYTKLHNMFSNSYPYWM